jgi:hypothetical protein
VDDEARGLQLRTKIRRKQRCRLERVLFKGKPAVGKTRKLSELRRGHRLMWEKQPEGGKVGKKCYYPTDDWDYTDYTKPPPETSDDDYYNYTSSEEATDGEGDADDSHGAGARCAWTPRDTEEVRQLFRDRYKQHSKGDVSADRTTRDCTMTHSTEPAFEGLPSLISFRTASDGHYRIPSDSALGARYSCCNGAPWYATITVRTDTQVEVRFMPFLANPQEADRALTDNGNWFQFVHSQEPVQATSDVQREAFRQKGAWRVYWRKRGGVGEPTTLVL